MRIFLLMALAALPVLAQNVQYHGGPVIPGARVFNIWYGKVTEANKVSTRSLVTGLNSSPYMTGLAGYTDTTGRSISNTSALLGEFQDNYSEGLVFDGAGVVRVINKAIVTAGWPCDGSAVYALVVAVGVSASYGGFHNGVPCKGVGPKIAYTVSPEGNSYIYSHELVEALSDPRTDMANVGSWFRDSDELEIADICQSSASPSSTWILSTGAFVLANYVQASGGCTSGGTTGGGGGGGVKPPKPTCPPGTKPVGNSGKCR